MKRYEGFLRGRYVQPSFPRLWWCVAVELQPAAAVPGKSARTSALASWHAVELVRHGRGYRRGAVRCGPDAASFWRQLAGAAGTKRPVRLISPRALMAWQVLDLWARLETGALTALTGAVARQKDNCVLERLQTRGCLITSDPPTIGTFEFAEAGGKLTWVCAGNYGLGEPVAGIDAAAEAQRLAAAVCECSMVMDEHGLGGWALTAPGMAMKGWLGSYTGPAMYLASGADGDDLERSGSFGGLLLARPTGAGALMAHVVDARSQYPWIAAHYPQAVNMLERGLRGSAAAAAAAKCAMACIARVVVRLERPAYPARLGKSMVWPVGEFTTVLCGPELEEAQRAGHIVSVLAANVYDLGTPLADYQRRVWAARCRCQEGGLDSAAALVKRLGVGLVGKLAQRTEEWAEVVPDVTDPVWGSWHHMALDGSVHRYRARGGIVEVLWRRGLARHALPSLPLWIWSWGRRRLRGWMERAGLANVLYADTDGLVVLAPGLERLRAAGLVRSGGWGMLREVAGPVPCRVRGVRDLEIGGRLIKAGLAANGREGEDRLTGPAWYRLPWSAGLDPGWRGSWVEVVR